MMTTVQYRADLQRDFGTAHYAKTAYAELALLCLWAVVGLALTGLFFAMGLGDGIRQALMVAG